jgi:hypothetical protein
MSAYAIFSVAEYFPGVYKSVGCVCGAAVGFDGAAVVAAIELVSAGLVAAELVSPVHAFSIPAAAIPAAPAKAPLRKSRLEILFFCTIVTPLF